MVRLRPTCTFTATPLTVVRYEPLSFQPSDLVLNVVASARNLWPPISTTTVPPLRENSSRDRLGAGRVLTAGAVVVVAAVVVADMVHTPGADSSGSRVAKSH